MGQDLVFKPSDILIPKNTDMTKWATIACDQFSSEPEYWERVKKNVGTSPSTLNMMLPEAWLDGADMPEVTKMISSCMSQYLNAGVFNEYKNSFIFTRRMLASGKIRRGIVGALDLEAYEYSVGNDAPVRASENTVIDRLPPRIKAREQAELEMPHIMVLLDDEEKSVIETLEDKIEEMECVYDFDLMEGGGHISGYIVSTPECEDIVNKLNRMSKNAEKKYGAGKILMIVGDGNHSLAAAKTCWDNIKKNLSAKERESHPARYALVELNNIHDESLEIEPIHRAVFDVNEDLADRFFVHSKDLHADGLYEIGYFSGAEERKIAIKANNIGEAIGLVQDFLDSYVNQNGGRIDYIHGGDTLKKLTAEQGAQGFYMPTIKRGDLFKSVAQGGVFPKKSFSMGHAQDKRYYLEVRKIKV